MAAPDDISDLVGTALKGPQGPDDSGFHTGIIRSWNIQTGANIVEINGVQLPNLRTLRTGIGVSYAAGETVVILRKQTQYFILGKVASVGGGSSSGVLSGFAADEAHYTHNPTPFYPAGGQTISAYLGASARALVTASLRLTAYSYVATFFGLELTFPNGTVVPMGAGAVDSADLIAFTVDPASDVNNSLATAITINYLATPEKGHAPGLNVFKTMMAVQDDSPGYGVDIAGVYLTVIPL